MKNLNIKIPNKLKIDQKFKAIDMTIFYNKITVQYIFYFL